MDDDRTLGTRGGMDSGQQEGEHRLGRQGSPVEATDLLLNWLVAAAGVVLALLLAGALAVQDQILIAEGRPGMVTEAASETVVGSPSPTLASPTPELTASPTASLAVSAGCERPRGWIEYTIKWGDTLSKLATQHGLDVDTLKDANCLQRSTIYAGSILWVPSGTAAPLTTATPEEPRKLSSGTVTAAATGGTAVHTPASDAPTRPATQPSSTTRP